MCAEMHYLGLWTTSVLPRGQLTTCVSIRTFRGSTWTHYIGHFTGHLVGKLKQYQEYQTIVTIYRKLAQNVKVCKSKCWRKEKALKNTNNCGLDFGVSKYK